MQYHCPIPAATVPRPGGTNAGVTSSRSAAECPGGHRRAQWHKKLSTCCTSLYFLLFSASSCLWSSITSSPLLTAHLLRSCFFPARAPSTPEAGQWLVWKKAGFCSLCQLMLGSSLPAGTAGIPKGPSHFTSCVTVSRSSSATSASSRSHSRARRRET